MKIFLSWSGATSHAIAEKLHKWLPMVIQKVEPYISTEIEKGTRWGTDIAEELEKCTFGIACVTKENKEAPWLLFEAGALSKSVTEGKLAPLLFGLEQTDIQRSPLTQFQMTKFEKSEFFKLLRSINETLENGLDPAILTSLFEALWPQLDKDISTILNAVPEALPSGPTIDPGKIMGAMEELLTNSRSVSQVLSRPDRLLPEDYLDHVFRRTGITSRGSDVSRVKFLVGRAIDEISELRSGLDDEQKALLSRPLDRLEEARYRLSHGRVGREDGPRLRRAGMAVGDTAQERPITKEKAEDLGDDGESS